MWGVLFINAVLLCACSHAVPTVKFSWWTAKTVGDQIAASIRYLLRYQSRDALSFTTCAPSPHSECVERPLHGEPLATPGELVPVFGGSKPIGVTEPLRGSGVLMSSGELGISFSGSSGILILEASLL